MSFTEEISHLTSKPTKEAEEKWRDELVLEERKRRGHLENGERKGDKGEISRSPQGGEAGERQKKDEENQWGTTTGTLGPRSPGCFSASGHHCRQANAAALHQLLHRSAPVLHLHAVATNSSSSLPPLLLLTRPQIPCCC